MSSSERVRCTGVHRTTGAQCRRKVARPEDPEESPRCSSHPEDETDRVSRMKGRFLDVYRSLTRPQIVPAARRCGYNRGTIYAWRKLDAEFAEAMLEIEEAAIDRVESDAWENALNRQIQVLTEEGVQVVDAPGDRVLQMFLLKAHRPELYNERHIVTVGTQRDKAAEDRLVEGILDPAMAPALDAAMRLLESHARGDAIDVDAVEVREIGPAE